jgi:hypothetical protein
MAPQARVAELVDAHDSKSCSARSGGSIPSTGTSLRCFAATAGRPAGIVGGAAKAARRSPKGEDGLSQCDTYICSRAWSFQIKPTLA